MKFLVFFIPCEDVFNDFKDSNAEDSENLNHHPPFTMVPV